MPSTVLGTGDAVAVKTDMAPALVELIVNGKKKIKKQSLVISSVISVTKRGEYRLLWE